MATDSAHGARSGIRRGFIAVSRPRAATFSELRAAAQDPDTGVRVARGLLASKTASYAPPPMRELPGFTGASADDLAAGFVRGRVVRILAVS